MALAVAAAFTLSENNSVGTGLHRTASSLGETGGNSAWWVRTILDIHKANYGEYNTHVCRGEQLLCNIQCIAKWLSRAINPWSFYISNSSELASVLYLTYELGVFTLQPGIKGDDSPQNLGENTQSIMKWLKT